MKLPFLIGLAFVFFYGCKPSPKIVLQLSNTNYLKLTDSLSIPLDSITYPYSFNIYEQDSNLLFLNEGSNVISIYNFSAQKTIHVDINKFINERKNISINSAGIVDSNLLYLYSIDLHTIFFVDINQKLQDSLQLSFESDYSIDKQVPPPMISPTQRPLLYKNSIFTVGYVIGEDPQISDSRKYVIRETNKDQRRFYVNYPKEYVGKNWGGIYYRMVYNCIVDDTTMCISFPATSTVAIFNVNTKNVVYKTVYPDLSRLILPYKEKHTRTLDKVKIADHFFGQHSFRGIIYDRYRKLFYRFLLKPTDDKHLKLNHIGPQEKVILVYDSSFNYLGCKELDKTYSYYTYFVAKDGLYIQRIKNPNDESKIHFDGFSPDTFHTK